MRCLFTILNLELEEDSSFLGLSSCHVAAYICLSTSVETSLSSKDYLFGFATSLNFSGLCTVTCSCGV